MTDIMFATEWHAHAVGVPRFTASGKDYDWAGAQKTIMVTEIRVSVMQNGDHFGVTVRLQGLKIKSDGTVGKVKGELLTADLRHVPDDPRDTIIDQVNRRVAIFHPDGRVAQTADERRSIATRAAMRQIERDWNRPEVQAALAEQGIGPMTVKAVDES